MRGGGYELSAVPILPPVAKRGVLEIGYRSYPTWSLAFGSNQLLFYGGKG